MQLLERKPSENARTYAIRVLLHNIISLELAPGSAVSENELSATLNLSRTPVREALIELNQMRLVNILPQRGSYIAKIDYDMIEESRFMRLVLEVAVLKLACAQGIAGTFLTRLHANLDLERKNSRSGNSPYLLELDDAFHRLIFESVEKSRTYNLIHTQMIHFDRLRTLSLKAGSSAQTINDHENILYALEKRDAELAEMIMTRHLTRYQIEKKDLMKQYPDYFV